MTRQKRLQFIHHPSQHQTTRFFSTPHTRQCLQLQEVWSAITGDGIPSNLCRKARCSASSTAARRDVVKAVLAKVVDPGVQETKGRLASSDECIVDQGDNRRNGRARSTGAVKADVSAVPDGRESLRLTGDVGVSAAGTVVKAGIFIAQRGNICGNSSILVGGSGEVIGETAAGSEAVAKIVRCYFRSEICSSPWRS